MNPEFLRNIWRELSLHRLIMMPVILFAIFYLHFTISQGTITGLLSITYYASLFLLVVWGSGLAADAVLEEVREGTWNAQRMTPLGAWSMTWAKLLGSTIFVWYGTFFCLFMLLVLSYHLVSYENFFESKLFLESSRIILTGLFAQSLALFVALLFQRIMVKRSRVLVVLIQLFVIGLTFSLYFLGREFLPKIFAVHSWYDLSLEYEIFVSGSQIFFILGFVFGIYRLMRLELQLRNLPWDLPLAAIFLSLYLIGFVYVDPEVIPAALMKAVYLGIFFLCFLGLTFGSAFFSKKNVVFTRIAFDSFKVRQYYKGLTLIPAWIFTGFFCVMIAFALIIILKSSEFPSPLTGLQYIGLTIGLLLFISRDIGILLFVSWGSTAKRPEMTTLVYLILLYLLIPSLITVSDLGSSYWYPAIMPWNWIAADAPIDWVRILFVNMLVLFQALVIWWGVKARFEMHKRRLR